MNIFSTPKILQNLFFKKVVRNKYFVFAPDDCKWAIVNKTGKKILSLIQDKNSISQTIKNLQEEYTISKEEANKYLHSFIGDLEKSKLIYFDGKENIDWVEVDSRKPDLKGVCVEITDKCNLNCLHCFLPPNKLNGNFLPFRYIAKTIDELQTSNAEITLSGGEPFLRKDIFEIIKYANTKNVAVIILSNGTLITEQIASELSELKIKNIQISLDGGTEKTNNLMRGKGTYNKIICGIENLMKAGLGKFLTISFTPNKVNIKEIDKITKLVESMKIKNLHFSWLYKSGNADNQWDVLKLTITENIQLRNQLVEIKNSTYLNITGETCIFTPLRRGVSHSLCRLGEKMRIDSEGNVYPCLAFYGAKVKQFIVGNIRDNTLLNILGSENLSKLRYTAATRRNKIDKCNKCPWKNLCCAGCVGVAYLENGSIYSEYGCELFKYQVDKLIQEKAKNGNSK